MICISLEFGRIFDFWPQMTFFDHVRWPRMTPRCKKMNSGENFQSNDMHIKHIRYKNNVLAILTPIMTVIPFLRPWNCLKQPTFDVFRLYERFPITTCLQICRKLPDTYKTPKILEILELKKIFDKKKWKFVVLSRVWHAMGIII